MESEKRAQILTLAKKKFERFGFNKTTVDEIAKDANISKRTLYQEFENKEKILEELFMFEALSDNVQDIVDKFNAQDIVDKRSLTIK